MKFKFIVALFTALCSFYTSAQWFNVGKGDYNWGPFLVYRIALYTETGNYQQDERPVMLSFYFEKQVEGKSFAVSLIKEISRLKQDIDGDKYLQQLQNSLQDFSPKDRLNYIALADKGYFVLNDTVLSGEFDGAFNQGMLDIWLSDKASDQNLRKQLLNNPQSELEQNKQPESVPFDEEESTPQAPPSLEQPQLIKDRNA